MADKFCWSRNEEEYQSNDHDTREDALLDAIAEGELEVGDTVWTAVSVPIEVKTLIHRPYNLVEGMQERASEECGEAGDDWLDHVTKEQFDDLRDRLVAPISDWLAAHNNMPHFWGVKDVQEHTVTAEQVALVEAANK